MKMEWGKLLTNIRLIDEEKEPDAFSDYYISPFERDYEKIVSSASFRRLQDKTQVFPLSKSDFVRTRLTHSIEVSTIAKQLGIMCFQNTSKYQLLPIDDTDDEEKIEELKNKRIGDIEAILSCAGLLHDLGNPPFGHVGEEIIGSWFKENLEKVYILRDKNKTPVFKLLTPNQIKDLEKFEGNAQALRILLKARHQSEINLPFSIISALIKYPTRCDEIKDTGACIRKKMGCYQAEDKVFLEIAKKVGTINEEGKVIRHPLAYLVEAADDIAYRTADLEDAVKSGIVSVDELVRYFRESLEELKKEYKGADQHISKTKEVIDKLENINKNEKDKTKVMSQWGTYLRRWLMYVVCWRFSKDYDSIMEGKFEKNLFYNTNHSLTMILLKNTMKEFVYNSRVITEPEISAEKILGFLLDKFVPVLVRYDDEELTARDERVLSLISSNYIDDYNKVKELDNITDEAELLYRRILIAIDYISGMTDGYAKMLYKIMKGVE